ncbi:MAG: protein-glutamate O-methyltransferase [Gammaproteobacteria bacterium]|nr:protein-glutamate O-methyltransferase [Gammaproteobacteria bacterium]
MPEAQEFEFNKKEFDYLRSVVKNETGIISDEGKYTMYYSRLSRRLRKLKLSNFVEYISYLENNLNSEVTELVNAVTTNLTAFFREEHHFDFLKESIIREKRKKHDKTLRIWSAACSTGEEAYSIAMSIKEALHDYKDWDIKILATDIDSNVVAIARAGVYKDDRVGDLDHSRIKRFMKKGTGSNSGYIRMNKDVVEMVKFNKLNLLKPWPMKEKFDVIFCRNVVIYFDKETKMKLVARFHQQLLNKGYLIMGHSESLYQVTDDFELLGKTVYQKL